MQYNFDEIIDRHGTDAIKIEVIEKEWKRTDLLPLWVADMDFRTPACVLNAIRERLDNGVMGYTCAPDSYFQSIVDWCYRRYGWSIQSEAITYVPGIVPGIGMAIESFTNPGDKVMIQPPVYHPFRILSEKKGRQVVSNPLLYKGGRYEMDFERMEKDMEGCKLFILCNPHNPGGRVWTREELLRVADVCHRHNVLVFSDEIHCDLTFKPYHHTPYASISEEARMNSVTFMSPSKAFNMAGLVSSQALIFNSELREHFKAYLEAGELNMGHVFSYLSVRAAYTQGEPWLEAVLDYIKRNILYIDSFLRNNISPIKAVIPQASYLIFLDCRDLHLSQMELNRFFIEKARLALNDGEIFGKEGIGFMRLNAASPRSVIEEAMNRLQQAYKQL